MKDPKSDVGTISLDNRYQHEVNQSESLRRSIDNQLLVIQNRVNEQAENLNELNETELGRLNNLLANFIWNLAPGESVPFDVERENTEKQINFQGGVQPTMSLSGRLFGPIIPGEPPRYVQMENIKCPHCEGEITVKVLLEK